jgi:two-component system, chemotaxis family, protein-glutamate methylesterase/glutaminase
MRKLITDFLSEHEQIEVIGTARNGEDALKKIQTLQPDVVTLDVEMPVMNGLEALKKIMEEHPLPVLMLSSTTAEGAKNTVLAMQYGAFDFITKPSGTISLDLHLIKDELIKKVLAAGQINEKTLKKLSDSNTKKEEIEKRQPMPKPVHTQRSVNWKSPSNKIVVIGTSTGGPRALQQVLTVLPKDFPAPVLIVQHMPPGFTRSLALRLDSLCQIHVKEAEDGEIIQNGTAYIAPGGYHMTVKKVGSATAIQLLQTPPKNGHRPSVDVMFESVSHLDQFDKIAVIMTGMGSDGKEGLISLKQRGEVIAIAESEESCIVFGMPKAAIQTNLVNHVEEVNQIAYTILKYFT